MSLKIELDLRSALLSTALVQPIDSKSRGKHMEILCRQIPGQEKPWLVIVRGLLEAASTGGFELHVCRRYVLKDGQLAYGWNLGLEAGSTKKLAAAVEAMSMLLAQAKPLLASVVAAPPPLPSLSQALKPALTAQQNRKPLAPAKKHVPGKGNTKQRLLPHVRPANAPGTVEEPPPGFMPRITTVSNGIDESSGQQTLIREMPLPHVYRDLNKPTPGGKGARLLGGK